MYKDKGCGQISLDNIDQVINVAGWVDSWRDHGSLLFFDLRDSTGTVQVVFDKSVNSDNHEIASSIRNEWVIQIKGIGRWTAEMILIFKLGRPNVMPVTDLGIQKGYALIFGLKSKPTPATILDRSRLWEPYRSTVALHCWNAVDDVEWSL